jgi:uncharacterized protein HemY
MMEMPGVGKGVAILGLMLLVIGGVLMLVEKGVDSGSGLGWLGRLPGDVVIKRENFTIYIPLATSVVLSVIGSLLMYVMFNMFKR